MNSHSTDSTVSTTPPHSRRTTRARRHRSQRRVKKEIEEEDTREIESRQKLRDASTRMYYTKVVSALVIGLATGIIFAFTNGNPGSVPFNPDPTGIHGLWLLFPLLALLIAMFIVRFVWKFSREEIDHKRLVLSGTFSLVAVSVFSTGLTWMILTELTTPGYLRTLFLSS